MALALFCYIHQHVSASTQIAAFARRTHKLTARSAQRKGAPTLPSVPVKISRSKAGYLQSALNPLSPLKAKEEVDVPHRTYGKGTHSPLRRLSRSGSLYTCTHPTSQSRPPSSTVLQVKAYMTLTRVSTFCTAVHCYQCRSGGSDVHVRCEGDDDVVCPAHQLKLSAPV